MYKVSIVVPCYNEQKTIKEVLEKARKAVFPQGWGREIIVIDDGSKDNTRGILEKLKNEITVIFKEKNEGKGAALKEGFKVASGDYILIQDADLEYNPDNYSKLIKAVIDEGVDIVFGSRMLKKNTMPYSRFYYYGGMLVTKIFNLLFGAKLTDISTCYKLFPRRLVPKLIYLKNNDFVFDMVELTHQLVLSGRIIEVPIDYKARDKKEGKKMSWYHGVRGLFSMMRIKFGLDF